MSSIRRSLAYSTLDSYLSMVLQLGSTIVLSRLLTPEETGTFAVAAVFASLASTFRDFGVAEYLIQEKELTHDKIRAAFTVNIIVSWSMALALFVAAPFVGEFYRSPGIAQVMRVQMFSFLLIPFGAITMAWFRRELDFRPQFLTAIVANLVSFFVSIGGALAGWGYMALAWSSLAGVVCTVGASMWFRPADFPRWPGWKGVAEVFHFGKFASGIYLFGQLGRGAPEMLIGRAHNLASVAIYSRANGLVELFNRLVLRAVVPVCMPYFAQSLREQGAMKPGYLTSVSYLTAVGWPFLIFLGVISYSAIRIVYGIQWVEAAPLAQVVCAAACIELLYHLAKEALLAKGEVKASNLLQMGLQTSQVLGLTLVFPFGLQGAVWGVFAATVVGAVLSHWHLSRAIGLSLADVAGAAWPSLRAALIAVAPVLAWTLATPITEHNFARFAFGGGAIVIVIWLLVVQRTQHPIWKELQQVLGALNRRARGLLAR